MVPRLNNPGHLGEPSNDRHTTAVANIPETTMLSTKDPEAHMTPASFLTTPPETTMHPTIHPTLPTLVCALALLGQTSIASDAPLTITATTNNTTFQDYQYESSTRDLVFNGLGGRDSFLSGSGNDVLHGGENADYIAGGAGNDLIYGDNGNDMLDGGAGDDRIYGGSGTDRLWGGAGNDVLDGGTGFDIMSGSEGSDTYYVDDANDVVVEAEVLRGTDRVYASVSYISKSYVEEIYLIGTANIDIQAQQRSEVLVGNAGNNTIHANVGDDSVDGGAGDDILYGEWGADVLRGGPGRDQFVINFSDGGGWDRILDFTSGEDTLVLSGFTGNKRGTGSAIVSYPITDLAIDFATVAADALVETSRAHLVYVPATGNLFYNQNASRLWPNNAYNRPKQIANLGVGTILRPGDLAVSVRVSLPTGRG